MKSIAGLAGGIGHQGAACGILTGGALALSLASADMDEDNEVITARACSYVGEYVRRFMEAAGSTLCIDITRTNFEDDGQLRRYILSKSRACVKLASKSASTMVDIISGGVHANDSYHELNRAFSDREFHCAHSVIMLASEELNTSPPFSPHMLIPLNGGIGYSGATCSALLGGCIIIGHLTGGDTSQSGTVSTILRYILTLIQGSSAFNRLDLSPANDALARCAKLSKWFEGTFHSRLCRKLTQVDFSDKRQVQRYFDEDIVSRCIAMARETATKAVELAR